VFAPPNALAGSSPLTERLRELVSPQVRDLPRADQAEQLSLPPHGPGSLARDGTLIGVQIAVSDLGPETIAAVRDAGARVLDVSRDYMLLTAAVPEDRLRDVAHAPGVLGVEEVLTPMGGAVDRSAGTTAAAAPRSRRSNNTCATGAAISEATTQLKAVAARNLYDVDGSGVKVGVLSDSYALRPSPATTASQDVAAGDLPGPGNPCGRSTPVQVLDDGSVFSKADEGRAMLQAVHDVAPGASLAFATAENSDTSYAGNIQDLANAGADVIADDYIYFNEPFYQDSVIADAVNDVTAQGIPYFSMAYNNNRVISGNDSNSWEAPAFRNGGTCPAAVGGTGCMDFDPGAGTDTGFGVTVRANGTLRIDMQWAEPWYGVTDNFDLFITDAAGTTTLASSTTDNPNAVQPKPFEFAFYSPGSSAQAVQIVIKRVSGTGTPRLKWVNSDNGAQAISTLEYPVSAGGDTVGPTIFGHNGAASAQTIGAAPFSSDTTVEPYSSRGPVTHLFGPVDGVTPAAALGSPQVISKPDVVATDGGLNTFFGASIGGGLFRFTGTSQAAPHAAAVAALQLSAEPSLTQAEVKANQKSTAVPIPGAGPLVAGSGLIDARAALIAGDHTQPALTITKKPAKKSKSGKAKFEFDTEASATLTCGLDGKAAKPCSDHPTFTVKPGKHRIIVQATDSAGNLTAVNYSWTYKKKKKKH